MNDSRHVKDEISAYLDGEAEHAGQIEAHLRACPECARRYQELRAVAVQVRKLRAPEVRPEFVTRVLARVHEEAAPVAAPWWARLRPLPMALAAGTLAFIGAAVYFQGQNTTVATPATTATQAALVGLPSATPSTDQAPNVLSALSQGGVDVAQLATALGADDATNAAPLPEAEGEDDVTEHAIDTAFLAMLDDAWSNPGDDAFGAIDNMNSEEQAALQELLQNGAYSDATNEG